MRVRERVSKFVEATRSDVEVIGESLNAPRFGGGSTNTRGSPVNVRPLRDRVLLRRIEEPETRIGGIVVPDIAREKPQHATVIAVGSGRITDDGKTIPLDVNVGDRVLVGKYAGTEITLDGTEYLIVVEDEILGVIEPVREPVAA